MSALSKLISDLRERKLWPVAVALIAGIVAVPLVLAKSPPPQPTPVAGVATGTGAGAGATHGLPVVAVQSAQVHHQLTGRSHDPFAAQAASTPQTIATTTSSSASSTATAGSAGGSPATGGASGGGSTSTTQATTSTPVPEVLPKPKPAPLAPSGLRARQAYRVALVMTNGAGGLDTIDPLQRLSIVPNAKVPLLVELGVLQGGRKVLFAVRPGTVLDGPGSCIPGPLDCEIVSLAPGDVETLSVQVGTVKKGIADFAVASIGVDNYRTAAAARRARQSYSAAGRRLLSATSLPALSLFPYDWTAGVIVDQRNLSIAGGTG